VGESDATGAFLVEIEASGEEDTVGDGVAEGVGSTVGEGEGEAEAVGVGVTVLDGEGSGVGVAVATGVGVAVGDGDGQGRMSSSLPESTPSK
jgi:hypothetical protein